MTYSTSKNIEHEPIRLVTAHAERLETHSSSLSVSISINAVSKLSEENNEKEYSNDTRNQQHKQQQQQQKEQQKEEEEEETKKKMMMLYRKASSHSLSTSSRWTSKVSITQKNKQTDFTHKKYHIEEEQMTHERAFECILQILNDYNEWILKSIVAIGHRVVHGGTIFVDSVILNDDIVGQIEKVSHLAPLHNPVNLKGISIARKAMKHVPNIAVFDTSFHCSTMPPVAYTYPIPKEYREELAIRKYGFHGTSVRYVSRMAMNILTSTSKSRKAEVTKMVVAHLGNGASVTAVVNGKSVDTSMGFTPLSGLMMGTRSGSIDPSIVPFAANALQKSSEDIIRDLNKRSGLKGISNGKDGDMRSILHRANNKNANDEDAILARDLFVTILAKHIAAMMVSCGGSIDALVFTAGIGEHSAEIRSRTVHCLSPMLQNVELDMEKNDCHGHGFDGIISRYDYDDHDDIVRPIILVVPTDEEAMICEDCVRLLNKK